MKKMFLIIICSLAISAGQAAPVPEIAQTPEHLHEVIHHLYRWYLDEHDIEKAMSSDTAQIWLLNITPEDLDQDDRSQILKAGIPAFNLTIILKKTDYYIPELDIAVKSDNFKIIDVFRDPEGAAAPDNATVIELSVKDIRDYVFNARTRRDPLDPALGKHLREAVIRQVELDKLRKKHNTHKIYIAPLSPIANELWIFWETGRKLIRVASDIEIINPAMWRHEHLAVRVFDIDSKTVVSLSETPGSNAYMTRDQVGRALYNCIVLGEYREISMESGKP